MGDMVEAGRRADATKVANLVRDRYSNPAKDRVRSWVIAEIKATEPMLVLDLWGGGRSAEQMTAAGLSVLSVDRRDGFVDYGISAVRAERALITKATEGGYRAGWGSAARFAPECDAAWLDFMGHLAPVTIRTLRACRHMKVLAVTLMADRMRGAEDWTAETWTVMYRGAIDHYSGLTVQSVRKYERESGSWVLVFIARKRVDKLARERARSQKRMADPEYRAKQKSYLAEYRAKNIDRIKAAAAARWADNDQRERHYALKRTQYATDPTYRAKRMAYEAQPEVKARRLELARLRYRTKRQAEAE